MIDFEGFVQTEGQPIYLQIMRYIKQGLASGIIADGEELPSRRALSAYLTVNPNTVQKAYRLLEEEGLVQSHAGAKSFVCATERQRAALRRELGGLAVPQCAHTGLHMPVSIANGMDGS